MTREEMIEQINELRSEYDSQLSDEVIEMSDEMVLDQIYQLKRDLELLDLCEQEEL